MRTLRGKDGGKNTGGDRVAVKVITRNKEEFEKTLQALIDGASENERIYATVDARDIEKGIRNFKLRQLDAEYYGVDERHGFYIDSANRVVSSLQSPNARCTSLFLFDCDSVEEGIAVMAALDSAGLHKQIKHSYHTKNGKHIICEPFNPKPLSDEVQRIIHRNAMMLWAY